MATQTKGHSVRGKNVSGDEAIRKVIEAKAEAEKLRRMVAALKKDRDDLLSEYQDFIDARSIEPFEPKDRSDAQEDWVRVSFGDTHGMLMDRPAVDAFLSDLAILNPDEIVIGGDHVECGGWLAKKKTIGYIAYSDYTYQEDIKAGNWMLDEIAKAAPRAKVHYIEGNHEVRVERYIVDEAQSGRDAEFLYSLISPERLLRLKERNIRYYRRSETYVKGCPNGWIKLGKMFFTHTLGKGKNAARDAAQKTGGNVTYFCTHREDSATLNLPSVGLVKAFNPGCLCKLQPGYRHSDPTGHSHGYAVDVVAKSGNFQRIHVPIQNGESLMGSTLHKLSAKP